MTDVPAAAVQIAAQAMREKYGRHDVVAAHVVAALARRYALVEHAELAALRYRLTEKDAILRAMESTEEELRNEVARLSADLGRLRELRHHDMHAWKHDPNGPVC